MNQLDQPASGRESRLGLARAALLLGLGVAALSAGLIIASQFSSRTWEDITGEPTVRIQYQIVFLAILGWGVAVALGVTAVTLGAVARHGQHRVMATFGMVLGAVPVLYLLYFVGSIAWWVVTRD